MTFVHADEFVLSNGPLFWSFVFSALTFCSFLQLPSPTHTRRCDSGSLAVGT